MNRLPLPIAFFASLLPLLAQATPPPVPRAIDPASFPRSIVAVATGLEYVDNLTLKGALDLFRGHPAQTEPGLAHAVIEIPTGTCEKWEIKLDGLMHWDIKDGKPRHVAYLGYPCNYGIVPRALLGEAIGGDGDPLDVLVLGPALPRGMVTGVKLLGVIRLIDGGEKDDKLIAVPPESPLASANSVTELDEQFPGITAILQTWFENYKGQGKLTCNGFGGPDEAEALVAACTASYRLAEAKARAPGK